MKTVFHFAKLVIIPVAMLAFVVLQSMQSTATDSELPAAEVRIDNFTFGPETLTVPVDSTVTWLNRDDVPHTVASTDGVFRSKALDTDDKYSYTFTKAGTYEYFCSIHPKMVGKIIVQANSQHGR
ncbi:MAG TPA: cupredoxin family copper-binding protein [Terriglobales bacterium]|nr:cupredoxin family copper-binding protein [Terriglobales bacterium]